MSTTPAIEINRVSRFFGDTCAVNDLSFSVKSGEVLGFIGPNGAGKTTTMRILSTLDEPDWGDAYVDGFSVVTDPDRVRYRLGFMPDAYGAYPNVSCVEYLDFFARTYGLMGSDRINAIRRVFDFTHMDHMADKPMNGLSKGMKQRLCLGRALIHDPKVLILDEPAAGLDPRARIELKEMIAKLASDGKSLLISSHILSELAEMCDRVAIIEKGQLLATGSVDQILQQFTGETDSEESNLATIVVQVNDRFEDLLVWLEQQPAVNSVRRVTGSIEFGFSEDPNAQADLLIAIVNQGFRISSFAAKRRSLEEAFLRVTKGTVQ